MNTRMVFGALALSTWALCAPAPSALAVDAWTHRMFDDQLTTDVGDDPKLTPATVVDLKSTSADLIHSEGCPLANPISISVNHTPLVSDGLLFFGDWCGWFYVVDLQNARKRIIRYDTGAHASAASATATLGTYSGVQATPSIVTLSTGEKRIYIGVATRSTARRSSARSTGWT